MEKEDAKKIVSEVVEKVERGLKYDKDKPAMSLLPPDALLVLGKVMAFGASKYDAHNWRKGIEYSRLLSAAERHMAKFNSSLESDIDEESNLHHLAHAAVDIIMVLQFYLEGRGDLDDRFKK